MDRLTSLGYAHDAFAGATERKPRGGLAQTRDDELTIGQMSRLYDVSNNSTPADDQYKPGCGAGDKNHTHTGPPGQVAKGNAGPGNPCPPFP